MPTKNGTRAEMLEGRPAGGPQGRPMAPPQAQPMPLQRPPGAVEGRPMAPPQGPVSGAKPMQVAQPDIQAYQTMDMPEQARPERYDKAIAMGKMTPEQAESRWQQFQAGQLPGQQQELQKMDPQAIQAAQAQMKPPMGRGVNGGVAMQPRPMNPQAQMQAYIGQVSNMGPQQLGVHNGGPRQPGDVQGRPMAPVQAQPAPLQAQPRQLVAEPDPAAPPQMAGGGGGGAPRAPGVIQPRPRW
jgi:hypothetical protein